MSVLGGVRTMRRVFGRTFVLGILLVAALLVLAMFHVSGLMAAAITLVLVLLAIRAHDFDDEDEPTEVDAVYDPLASQWSSEERADLLRRRPTPYTPSMVAVLGQNHEGKEL